MISDILRIAVIPTRDRPEKYEAAYAAIRPQVDYLVTVAHKGARYASRGMNDRVLQYFADPPNISIMWTLGLDTAAYLAHAAGDLPHLVAFLNDDSIVAPNWFDLIQERMQMDGTDLGSGRRGNAPDRRDHVAGHAFILRGDTKVRPNSKYGWWVSDDWLEQEALANNGFSLVPKAKVTHLHEALPKDHPLQIQSDADLQTWLKEAPSN